MSLSGARSSTCTRVGGTEELSQVNATCCCAVVWCGVVSLRRAGTMPVTRLSLETCRTTFTFSQGEEAVVLECVQQLEACMKPLDTSYLSGVRCIIWTGAWHDGPRI